MKTFIRYPGNKSRHIRYIKAHLPEDIDSYTYIEPFVGSGALFLFLEPKKWIINDINQDLINLYRSICDDYPNLIKHIKSFSTRTNFNNISNIERKQIMKNIMNEFITLQYNTHRAAYYVLMNMTVYNSVLIFNGKYEFRSLDVDLLRGNKPRVLKDVYITNMKHVSILLNSNGSIYNVDYKQILKKTTKKSFCFIDPPYDEKRDYVFTYNIGKENKTNFVEELYKEVKKLDKKGTKWLMTQADTQNVRDKFKEYKIIEYPVYRGFKNVYTTELIIKNY